MLYVTMGIETGTTNRHLAEKLAEFYSKRLGYHVYITAHKYLGTSEKGYARYSSEGDLF